MTGMGVGRYFICWSGKSPEEVTFQVELKPEWVVGPGCERAWGRGPRWDELGTIWGWKEGQQSTASMLRAGRVVGKAEEGRALPSW